MSRLKHWDVVLSIFSTHKNVHMNERLRDGFAFSVTKTESDRHTTGISQMVHQNAKNSTKKSVPVFRHEPPHSDSIYVRHRKKNLPAGEGLMLPQKHYTTCRFQHTWRQIQTGLSGCSMTESVKLKCWIIFALGWHAHLAAKIKSVWL